MNERIPLLCFHPCPALLALQHTSSLLFFFCFGQTACTCLHPMPPVGGRLEAEESPSHHGLAWHSSSHHSCIASSQQLVTYSGGGQIMCVCVCLKQCVSFFHFWLPCSCTHLPPACICLLWPHPKQAFLAYGSPGQWWSQAKAEEEGNSNNNGMPSP